MTQLPATPVSADSTAAASRAVAAVSHLGHVLMQLTKARLSLLVLWTTAVGYLLALVGRGPFQPGHFAWTLIGTALAAASASVFNQLLEIEPDRIMHRTQHRPLPTQQISRRAALLLGSGCGVAGLLMLFLLISELTAGLAAITIVAYVAIYTPMKRRSTLNTFVGAICGAIPPMIGWAAVTGNLEIGAWILGAILFVWQIPHFLALAWLYRDDYERGGFMMLPVVDRAGRMTSRIVILTSLMLLPLSLLATVLGLAGWIYAAGATVLAAVFIIPAIRLFRTRSDADARRVFLASLLYLTVLMSLLVLDAGPIADHPLAQAHAQNQSQTVALSAR